MTDSRYYPVYDDKRAQKVGDYLGRHDQYASSLDKFCTEYTDFLLTRRYPGFPIDQLGAGFQSKFTICQKAGEDARKDVQESQAVMATVLKRIAEADKPGKGGALTVMKVSAPTTPGQQDIMSFLREHGYVPRLLDDNLHQRWMRVQWGSLDERNSDPNDHSNEQW